MGALGAVASTTGGVVTVAGGDGAETFPAASTARTEYVWVAPGTASASRKLVPDSVPTTVPSRKTSYPATPTSSVDDDHATSTSVGPVAVAVTAPGADGGVTSEPDPPAAAPNHGSFARSTKAS